MSYFSKEKISDFVVIWAEKNIKNGVLELKEKEFFKIEIWHNEQGKYLVMVNEMKNVFTTFAEFNDLESAEKAIDLITNIL